MSEQEQIVYDFLVKWFEVSEDSPGVIRISKSTDIPTWKVKEVLISLQGKGFIEREEGRQIGKGQTNKAPTITILARVLNEEELPTMNHESIS